MNHGKGTLGPFLPMLHLQQSEAKGYAEAHDAVDAETEKKKTEGAASRKADADEARADVTSAGSILGALVDKLREETPFFGGGDFGGDVAKRIPSPDDVMRIGSSVKGGFGMAASAQQLGIGNKTGSRYFSDTSKNTGQTAKNTEESAKALRELLTKLSLT
jgi:hypothetical protein